MRRSCSAIPFLLLMTACSSGDNDNSAGYTNASLATEPSRSASLFSKSQTLNEIPKSFVSVWAFGAANCTSSAERSPFEISKGGFRRFSSIDKKRLPLGT